MKRGVLLWFVPALLIGLLTIFSYSRRVGAPELANDSYQYLDAAAHLVSSACLCTSVAHFDEQLNWARIPIPFTHFGPGYPVAIAALKVFGVPGETAGYLLSVAGYLLVLTLIWLFCSQLEFQPWSIAVISLIWTFNSIALAYGVAVATDSLFTAVVLAICALVAYDIRNIDRPRPFVLLVIGALVGASYWLRQPGLFLLLPLFLYLTWRYVLYSHSRPFALSAALVALLCGAPVMIRNVVFAHSWNSGFANGRHTPWKDVLVDSLKAPYHLIFGETAVARLDLWTVIFFLSAALLFWRTLTTLRFGLVATRLSETSRTILAWLLVFAFAFVAGVLAAELSTYAASEVRYNFPVFPVLLIAGGVLLQLADDRIGRTAALLCALSIVIVNARSLLAARTVDQSSLPVDLLQQQVRPGLSIQAYLQTTLPRDAVLVATEGQAVYYLLKRPVVSIIEPQYSLHTWDEADVKAVMRSFGAQYFLLFPGAGHVRAPEQQASSFLKELTAGHPPSWLTVAARTPGVILYSCAACSTSASGARTVRRATLPLLSSATPAVQQRILSAPPLIALLSINRTPRGF